MSASASPLHLSIAGIRFRLAGLDETLAGDLERRFEPFVAAGDSPPVPADVDVTVTGAAARQFLPYPDEGGTLDYQLESRIESGRLRAWSYSFSGTLELDGPRATLELCRTDFEPAVRSVENFLRVALAWKAVERGGLLLHASGLARDGRAYVFFGPSGAGKTTVTRLSPSDTILNDDCILLAPAGEGFVAHGVPFKGAEDFGAADAGAFPIAGLFRLVQAKTTDCEPLAPALGAAEISGSIPFVTERAEGYSRVFPVLERLVRSTPVFRLRFRLSADFWPVVKAATSG